jgi:hypothetical protein
VQLKVGQSTGSREIVSVFFVSLSLSVSSFSELDRLISFGLILPDRNQRVWSQLIRMKTEEHFTLQKLESWGLQRERIWLLCHVHVASSVSWKTGCSVMFETLQHAATKVHWCVVSSPSYRQGQQTTTWLKLQQHEHYDHTEVICFATNSSKVSQLGSKMLEVWTKGMQFWTNLAWCTHFTLLTCFAT